MHSGDSGYWAGMLFLLAIVGIAAGSAWIWRIGAGDEDPNASFWRSHPRGGHGSRLRLPAVSDPPTWGWIVTRLEMAIAVGSVVAAIAGPALLTRWARPLEEHQGLATALWAIAIIAALVGATLILRIGLSDPEREAPPWRLHDLD